MGSTRYSFSSMASARMKGTPISVRKWMDEHAPVVRPHGYDYGPIARPTLTPALPQTVPHHRHQRPANP